MGGESLYKTGDIYHLNDAELIAIRVLDIDSEPSHTMEKNIT